MGLGAIVIVVGGSVVEMWVGATNPAARAEAESGEPADREQERKLSLVVEARIAVKSILIDPESARFEAVAVQRGNKNREVVCGLVNSKNRFGGYVGRTRFAYDPATKSAMLASPNDPNMSLDQFNFVVGNCP